MSDVPSNEELEARATEKGAVFVNESKLAAHIAKTDFYIHPDSQLTICIVTMLNGYTVTGESACADPKMFDKAIGEKCSFAAAERKIWPLLGYVLRDELYKQSQKGQGDTFLDRMKNEEAELNDKINKLRSFVSGHEHFKALHDDQKALLLKQLDYMEGYAAILTQRIYANS